MPCTTILVGKKASYDGSTIIARNDDSGAGHYTAKKFAVIWAAIFAPRIFPTLSLFSLGIKKSLFFILFELIHIYNLYTIIV